MSTALSTRTQTLADSHWMARAMLRDNPAMELAKGIPLTAPKIEPSEAEKKAFQNYMSAARMLVVGALMIALFIQSPNLIEGFGNWVWGGQYHNLSEMNPFQLFAGGWKTAFSVIFAPAAWGHPEVWRFMTNY